MALQIFQPRELSDSPPRATQPTAKEQTVDLTTGTIVDASPDKPSTPKTPTPKTPTPEELGDAYSLAEELTAVRDALQQIAPMQGTKSEMSAMNDDTIEYELGDDGIWRPKTHGSPSSTKSWVVVGLMVLATGAMVLVLRGLR